MKYIKITEYGGPEVLKTAQGEIPGPAQGEVLIKVEAAGVNRPDIFQRQGNYPPPPGASEIPGLEVAGEVIATGGGVNYPQVGSKVCALLTGGGYAEYAVAPASLCLPVPKALSTIEAAALPETFFTVWSNVYDRARLKPGETLLIHGGSSGIGTTAIQLGKAFDATVLVTAGSSEKCQACRDLGADLAINYQQQDFVAECLNATGDHGVDVILDMVAGDYIDRDFKAAAPDGRIVIIAGLRGYQAELNLLPLMLKRLTLTGSTLRSRPVPFKAEIAAKLKRHVWPLLDIARIRPVIYKTLSLEEAAKAHKIMETNEHIGKIILVTA